MRHAPPGGVDEATSKAHYSLGVLLASTGDSAARRPAPAGRRSVSAELRRGPHGGRRRAPPHGRAPRRRCRITATRIAINPRQTVARLGYAMALVQLRRYREARDWLDESVRLFGDRADLKIALARLARDEPGRAASATARAPCRSRSRCSMQARRRTALGETIAMALAEQGNFAQAIAHPARRDGRGPESRLDRSSSAHDREPRALRTPPALPYAVDR